MDPSERLQPQEKGPEKPHYFIGKKAGKVAREGEVCLAVDNGRQTKGDGGRGETVCHLGD